MLVAIIALSFIGGFINLMLPIILGNIASFGVTYYYNSFMIPNDRWDGYFVPLDSIILIIVVSILILIPQFIAYKLGKRYAKKYKQNIAA